MNEFDELIEQASGQNAALPSQQTDKAAWAEQKKQERQAVYDMVDEAAALTAVEPGMLAAYLDCQSHFDRYSARNALLVAFQCPEATKLATFEEWKAKGVHIRKGETAISILVPGKEYARRNGGTGVNFQVGKVFDISQTDCAASVRSASHDPRRLLESLIRSAPCGFEVRAELDTDARFSPQDRKILVRQGQQPQALFRAISREMAVCRYSNARQRGKDIIQDAHCISYILCQRFGISTDEIPLKTVTESMTGLETRDIQTRLKRIRELSGELTDRLRQQLEPTRKQHRSEEAR